KVAAMLGPAAVTTFLISAVLCTLLILCFAELAGRFHATGGPMLNAEAAFGRTAGFVVGWLGWLTRLVAWAALVNGLFTASVTLFPAVEPHRIVVIVGAIAGLTGVNVIGVALGSRLTNVFTVAKMVPILVVIAVGVFRIRGDLFVPFAPNGFGELGPATLVILFAFVGFEVVSVPAGEMRDPTRSLPRALLLLMAVVTVTYFLLWAVCQGTLPELAGAENPVADAAVLLLGPVGGTMIAAGIFVSVLGVNSASALVAPRCLYALARDGMLPGFLARVHPRTRTPIPAILLTSGLTMLLAVTGSFVELAVMSMVARMTQYYATCGALLRLRAVQPDEASAFRAPGGPVVAVLAMLLCTWLLVESDPRHLMWGGVGIVAGLVLHLPFRRRVSD
ncbi:MAG TPA: amino acid permease, partial [bacterium]|nr:amino acid permease [bacterium]